MRSHLVLPLLLLAGCSGWVDPNDFYLPRRPQPDAGPGAEPGADPLQTQRTSRHAETGELAARWTVLSYPDGRVLKDGREEHFHPDGSPSAVRHFDQGQPLGEWRSWYPDGTLRSEYVFATTPTPQRFYHPSGQPSATGPALAGVRAGAWAFWYEDGQMRQEGDYSEGRKHGAWSLYYENGGLRSRGWYADDERVGEWRHWREKPPTGASEWWPREPALF